MFTISCKAICTYLAYWSLCCVRLVMSTKAFYELYHTVFPRSSHPAKWVASHHS